MTWISKKELIRLHERLDKLESEVKSQKELENYPIMLHCLGWHSSKIGSVTHNWLFEKILNHLNLEVNKVGGRSEYNELQTKMAQDFPYATPTIPPTKKKTKKTGGKP